MRSRLLRILTPAAVAIALGCIEIASTPHAVGAGSPVVALAYHTYLPVVFSSLPTSSPTPTSVPTSTPVVLPTNTPSPASPDIEHTSLYVDSINYTHVLGEVVNNSGATIYYPMITVTFFNADGSVAGTHQTSTYASMVQNGEKASFDDISQPQAGWSRYTLALSYEGSTYLTYSHAFAFSGQNHYSGSLYEYFTGLITNNSGQSLQYPMVILTGYDSTGNVVVADFTYANAASYTLAPGETAPYEIDVPIARASLVAGTAFVAEGWR